MIRFIALLAVLFLAAPTTATEIPAASEIGGGGRVNFHSTNAVGDFSDEVNSCSTMVGRFRAQPGLTVSLYSVDSADDTLAEIEASQLLGTFLTNNQSITFTPARPFVRAVVDSALNGAGQTASLTFSCNNFGAAPGAPRDVDSNGLFEWATLFDADLDGSGPVTCTAKDVPDLACKVAGQVIYRDWMDDANVMLRDHMDHGGTLQLPAGTLVSWPCYDASRASEDIIDPKDVEDDALVRWNDPRIETEVQFTGTSTSGSNLTLVDSAAPFVDSLGGALDMTGWELTVTLDAGIDRHMKIASNTSTTVTLMSATDDACYDTNYPFSGCTGSGAGDATTEIDASDAYSIVVGSAWRDNEADASYGDCPADGEDGSYKLINLATRDWSGTITGMGADPLENDTTTMAASSNRTTGPIGTFIAQDYGTDDNFGYSTTAGSLTDDGRSGWYGTSRKNRHIVLGVEPWPNTEQRQAGSGGMAAYTRTHGPTSTDTTPADGISDDWNLIVENNPTTASLSYQFDDTAATFTGGEYSVGDRMKYTTAGGVVSWHTVTQYATANRMRFTPNLADAANVADTYSLYSVQNWDNSYVCVCPTAAACGGVVTLGNDGGLNFIDELNKDDVLFVQNEFFSLTPVTMYSGRVLEDGTAFTDTCGPGASPVGERVYLGNLSVDAGETDHADRASGAFYGRIPKNGLHIGVVKPGDMEAFVTITNLTIGPNDFMNEAGGDCATVYTAPWQETENSWSDGVNCDTGHMAAFTGQGAFTFDRVIFMHGASYVVDGINHAQGRNMISRSSFLFQSGKGIVDGPWNLDDVEIRDGHFYGDVLSAWMGPQKVSNVRVVNNIFGAFTTCSAYCFDKIYENIRFLGNTMSNGWYFNGGTHGITIRDIYVDGWRGIGVRYPSSATKLTNSWVNSVVVFDGATQARNTSGNTIDGITLTGSIGNVIGFGEASIGADYLKGNTIRNIKHFTLGHFGPELGTDGQQVSNQRNAGPGAIADPGTEWCTIVFRANGSAGDDGESQIAANNFFFDVWNDSKSVPLFGIGTQNNAGCEYALYATSGAVPVTTDCSDPTGAAECITGCGLAQEDDYFTVQSRCE